MFQGGLIYVVTNTATGKQYVGQTTRTIERRWLRHKACAAREADNCRYFHRAIRKYGPESFVVEVVSRDWHSRDALDRAEQDVIRELNTIVPNGYNLDSGGRAKGKHPETRLLSAIPKLGKTASPEARARMSAAHKGKKFTAEHAARIGDALRGRPIAAWRAEKMHAACRGKHLSPEHKAKVSAASKGRPCSAETRQKRSVALKGRTYTPEQRKRMSEGMLRYQAQKRRSSEEGAQWLIPR